MAGKEGGGGFGEQGFMGGGAGGMSRRAGESARVSRCGRFGAGLGASTRPASTCLALPATRQPSRRATPAGRGSQAGGQGGDGVEPGSPAAAPGPVGGRPGPRVPLLRVGGSDEPASACGITGEQAVSAQPGFSLAPREGKKTQPGVGWSPEASGPQRRGAAHLAGEAVAQVGVGGR